MAPPSVAASQPGSSSTSVGPVTGSGGGSGSSSAMPPPQAPTAQPIAVSTASIASPQEPTAIAPQPSFGSVSNSLYEESQSSTTYEAQLQDKKQQKRAANRRSAQLSRKRKKQFIEELKEENDELRRKEQILKSIPDLIVVFDSSGKLWFVSQSVDRFLSFTSAELEGTSFWDRLCEDSVRLLKAAFMDSLAARQPDSDTAPLGSGVWELRLVDKNGSQKIITLNGVVHFAGERPECVCSIRPRDDSNASTTPQDKERQSQEAAPTQQAPDRTDASLASKSLLRVKPQQSVVSSGSSDGAKHETKKNGQAVAGKRGEAVRISDSGNSSVESECGSSDE